MTVGLLRHEFVDLIPDELAEGTVYVSIPYATVVHKCCCGCGNEVVTPLGHTDWQLVFDGESISLTPSIGNWSLPCQSHYWIRWNRVKWAPRWTAAQIGATRAADRAAKEEYFAARSGLTTEGQVPERRRIGLSRLLKGVWTRLGRWTVRIRHS
jgi:hypothetical protein